MRWWEKHKNPDMDGSPDRCFLHPEEKPWGKILYKNTTTYVCRWCYVHGRFPPGIDKVVLSAEEREKKQAETEAAKKK